MRIAVVTLAASMAMAGVPGAGLADGDHALSGEGGFEGDGWALVDVADDDGHLRVTVTADATARRLALGVDVLDGRNRSLFLSTAAFTREVDGARVEVGTGQAELVQVHRERDRLFRFRGFFSVHAQVFDRLEGRVVLWSAGPVANTSWSVEGGTGSTVDSVREGSDAFLATEDDLEGPAEAELPLPGLRAQLVARETVQVDGSLVGVFDHGDASRDRMRAEGPGVDRSCPCAFGDLGPAAPGPGEHAFTATGAGLGEDRWILLTGADVAAR